MKTHPEIISRLKQAHVEFGMSRLKQARLSLGMSLHALATACDIDAEILELIEDNPTTMRLSAVHRMCIARVLRVPEEQLFPER